MNKQKTINTKTSYNKTVTKNSYKQKHKYFVFDVNGKKWQDIYTVIIK